MNKHITIIAGFCAAALTLASCGDEFLEVKNPTGEPLEEYYTTEETLNEALTSAYAPLHWPRAGTMLPTMTSPSTARLWVMTSG